MNKLLLGLICLGLASATNAYAWPMYAPPAEKPAEEPKKDDSKKPEEDKKAPKKKSSNKKKSPKKAEPKKEEPKKEEPAPAPQPVPAPNEKSNATDETKKEEPVAKDAKKVIDIINNEKAIECASKTCVFTAKIKVKDGRVQSKVIVRKDQSVLVSYKGTAKMSQEIQGNHFEFEANGLVGLVEGSCRQKSQVGDTWVSHTNQEAYTLTGGVLSQSIGQGYAIMTDFEKGAQTPAQGRVKSDGILSFAINSPELASDDSFYEVTVTIRKLDPEQPQSDKDSTVSGDNQDAKKEEAPQAPAEQPVEAPSDAPADSGPSAPTK